MSEIKNQNEIRQGLNTANTRAWRNNVGFAKINGRPVNFGIPGKGGSDLIGLHSFTIQPEHVGKQVAVFLAIECKSATGKPTKEQTNFINYIKSVGGIAGVARSIEDAEKIIQCYNSTK